MNSYGQQLLNTFKVVIGGVGVTLEYTVLSAIGGVCIGLCLALLKVGSHTVGKSAANFYTSLFRGTPLLVQLSLIYFGPPSLLGYKISPLMAGVIAFSLNSGLMFLKLFELESKILIEDSTRLHKP